MVEKIPLSYSEHHVSFPHFTIVSASAGSGKTHTLTLRLLRLFLSPDVPHHSLKNIVAMTFTNNAVNQIKKKVLEYLKRAYFDDASFFSLVQDYPPLFQQLLRERSHEFLTTLLKNYSDFHVETIDSFLTRLFRSTAVELGIPFNYTISFSDEELLQEALPTFLDSFLQTESGLAKFEMLLSQMQELSGKDQKFLWDPYTSILDKLVKLFATLAHYSAEPSRTSPPITNITNEVYELWQHLEACATKYDLELKEQYHKQRKNLSQKNYDAFFKKQFQIPFKKPSSKQKLEAYNSACTECEPILETLTRYAAQYAEWKSRTSHLPTIEFYYEFKPFYEAYKQREGVLPLSDVSKKLAAFLNEGVVPEIYTYIGEQVYHYLVDEFQDTSPLQWSNIRPLCDNALANGGSLFIVGDTKQSIFSFRGADWRIMKHLMQTDEFPSTPTTVTTLPKNYRSNEAIVSYVHQTFQHHIPTTLPEEFSMACSLSGLQDDMQEVHEHHRNKGCVQIFQLSDPAETKDKLLELLADCFSHGYRPNDIAILTVKNQTVLEISSWLNDAHIDFISYSTLDCRNRKIIQELLSLLQFLDSPINNIAFATILLSDIFKANIEATGASTHQEMHACIHHWYSTNPTSTLYRFFEQQYPELWNQYFDELFRSVGYLALYDLVMTAYKRFRLFELFPQEEAALVQCLESLHAWEIEGKNDIQEFLAFAAQSTSDAWTIDIPEMNAVSIMTIHQAKGLGFPVVLLLLYDERLPNTNLFIEERNNELILWKITKELAECSDVLLQKRKTLELLQNVDLLNKLYVALTRAEEEMYILNVLDDRYRTFSKLLPLENISLTRGSRKSHGVDHTPTLAALHTANPFTTTTSYREQLKQRERRRGDLLHEVLSKIEFIPHSEPLEKYLQSIVSQVGFQSTLSISTDELLKTLVALFAVEDFAEFFHQKEHRTVLCEADFATSTGQLYRMDRVILEPDCVTVVDFKTGHEEADHEQQIRTYMDILKELYTGKIIRGALAYIDHHVLRWFS